MKWSELTLEERKQIYDSVRADNKSVSYLDIKSQFDSIPAYEDGGKNNATPTYSLPEINIYPQNRFGDIARSQGIETARNWKTIKEGTTAGINEFANSPQAQFVQAVLPLPSGIDALGDVIKAGKTLKNLRSKVGRIIDGTNSYAARSYAEPFTPTVTNKSKKVRKVKTEADYDPEFREVLRKRDNIRSYEKELSDIANSFLRQGDGSEVIDRIDNSFGTNYKRAASQIVHQDMANRGKYVQFKQIEKNGNPVYGSTVGKSENPEFEDMKIYLNPDYYLQGTANHEISHLADAMVNKAHTPDATNNYLNYLLDEDNIMSYNEIRQNLMDVNPGVYDYIIRPSENKAHMIQLKRGMKNEGLINSWSDNVTSDKIENYLSYGSKNANKVNPVLRTLYDIRADKQGFVNRMNNLTPIEWAAPIGFSSLLGGSIYESEDTKNNKSN